MSINYGANKGKIWTEEEDRFLICMTNQMGYGNWEELKLQVRQSWLFRFNWFIKKLQASMLNKIMVFVIFKKPGAIMLAPDAANY